MERRRDLSMEEVLALQEESCARAGSALYARFLQVMRDDVERCGPIAALLDPWAANAMADAIPLRLLAALHALVLSGSAPELARWFPSVGGSARIDDPALAAVLTATVEEHRASLGESMALGVQTNEVGRAATLVGGFSEIWRRFRLPLRCLEVGASAGLLMHWDRYGYRAEASTAAPGGWSYGGDAPMLRDPWVDRVPPRCDDLVVAERAGCDIAPIDVTSEAGLTRLRSFLWPDQIERRTRLDEAVAVARNHPTAVEAADAGEWVERQLARARPGAATVVYHSIVLQYLPRDSFRRMRSAIEAAGAAATPDAPVCWLRMEPAGEVADLRLRTWSGRAGVDGEDELLATTAYHGPPVRWLGRS